MLRGASGIRVLGLVFLLVSLFEPLTIASTFAETDPPPPDETLLESTPPGEPVPEPTVEILPTESAPEPTAEPTVPPTEVPTIAPTAEPTLPPTEVPTAEPTIEPTIPSTVAPTPEPTIEATAAPTESTIKPTAEPTVVPTRESTPEPPAARSVVSMDTNAEPDVTISTVADEAQMPFGGVPGFTITVTNNGDAPATDVAFEDHLPYQSSLPWELQSQFAQCDIYQDPDLLECAGIDLEPGDDFEVHVTAQRGYTAGCDTTLESTARLTQGGVGEATASVSIMCPDPVVTVELDDDVVTAGDDIGLTITFSNLYPASYGLYFEFPENHVSGVDLGWHCEEGDNCRFNASGDYPISITHYLEGRTFGSSCGTHEFSAVISHPVIRRAEPATLTILCPEPDVTISKVADEEQMPYSEVPGFTITVTNNGDAPATDVAFEDYLPYRGGLPWELRSQFENCVLDLNNDELLECAGIDLEPGEDFEVRVTAFYDYSASCDTTLESTARLTHGGEGEATAGIYVVCPDLAITVLPDSDKVIVGNDLGVTIRISNASSFEADPVTIIGQLPVASGLEWSTSGPGCYIASTAKLDCNYVTIPANGSLDVRVTSPTTDASCGEYSLSAEIDHPYPISADHSATITVLCFEPELPEITQAACVDGEFTAPEIELATTDHVTYTLDPASGWAAGDTVTVIATLDDGYGWPVQLPEGWSPVPDVPKQVTATIELEILDCPLMEITRTIEPTVARLGDEVTLSYEITNTGNVPLEDVYVSDYLLGTVGSCSLDVFPPEGEGEGEHTHRCTVTTTVVEQPERDGIFKSDWASVWGNHDGEWFTASTGSLSVTIEPDSVDTIAVTTGADDVVAGDPVSYTITVENTGEVTSGNYGMQDPLPAIGEDPGWEIISTDFDGLCAIAMEDDGSYLDCFVEPLASGESRSVTVQHPTSFASCGEIMNKATLYRAGGETHASDSASVAVLCPEISFDLSAKPVAGTEVREGDEIAYTLTVANAGDVPLTNVAVDTDIAGFVDEPIGDLDVDGSVTLQATYTVTASDVAAGEITRTANVTGEASTGIAAPGLQPVTITHSVVQEPSIALGIDANLQAPTDDHPLGAIGYTFTVTNTGDSTLTGIQVTASLPGDGSIPVDDLGPGGTTTVEETYVLTQADIDAGAVSIEASAGGMPPGGPSGVRDYASVTVELPQEATLAIAMTTNADEVAEGHDLTFTFEVTNTGNVTVRDITITTTLAGLVWDTDATDRTGFLTFAQVDTDGLVGDLAPGGSRSLTAAYTVTDDDEARGEVRNTATVTGLGPTEEEITATAEPVAVTVIQPAPDPAPDPTVPPTPEPTVLPTVPSTPGPTTEPEGTPAAPTPPQEAATPLPGEASTPAADGTTISVSSLPSTGAGASDAAIAGLVALLIAALLATGGVLAHRQRR